MAEQYAEVLRYQIPPRPNALVELAGLMKATEPDIDKIIQVLKSDASLYSTTLASVNTPVFSRGKKIASIHHAVMLLGLKRLYTLLKVSALKATLSKAGNLDRFWDSASEIATLTAKLAGRFTNENLDAAYTLGMLHDCGIPMMLEVQPAFRRFLIDVNVEDVQLLKALEMETFKFDHFSLGSQIAQHWSMPRRVINAIRLQPDYLTVLKGRKAASESEKSLLCCLMLAKDISEAYRHYWRIESPSDTTNTLHPVLEYLGLPDIEYTGLREDYIQALENE